MLTVRLLGEVVTQWTIQEGRPVTWLDLISTRRDVWTARCRHLVCWLARRRTSLSYPEIGRALGDRDQTTILHAVRGIDQLIELRDAELHPQTVALISAVDALVQSGLAIGTTAPDIAARILARSKIGRASCRERG